MGERPVHGSVLSDGFGVGTWRVETDPKTKSTTLTIDHVSRLSKRASAAIAAEGRRALRLLQPDAGQHDVRLVALD